MTAGSSMCGSLEGEATAFLSNLGNPLIIPWHLTYGTLLCQLSACCDLWKALQACSTACLFNQEVGARAPRVAVPKSLCKAALWLGIVCLGPLLSLVVLAVPFCRL